LRNYSEPRLKGLCSPGNKASSRALISDGFTPRLSPGRLRATMKKFVALLLCLSLSIFAVARAMKPAHTPAAVTKTAKKKPTGQKADAKTLLDDASKALAAMIKADGDSMEDASDDDEGENMSDDDSGGDDDSGDDDGGGDDGGDVGGDDGGDNGGGDEGD